MKPLPLRRVAMRDGLFMYGDHETPFQGRHWKAAAAAFALLDPMGHPVLWIEGMTSNTKVVGEMAITVASPRYRGRRNPGLAKPGQNRTLKWWEVVRVGGVPIIRTHWAAGDNFDRTSREIFDEVAPHSAAERQQRYAELDLMMGI